MKKHKRLALFLLGLALLALVIVFIFFRPGGSALGRREATILFLGLDKVGEQSRSDTIILVHIKGQDVALISLPRDLRLQFPDGKFHKLNAAYALGQARLAQRVVSDFLAIPVPFYALLDYEGFQRLVDQLGGVTLTVEKHLKYEDKAQNLYIDIPPGEQLLDGKKALDYIRYRDETGDFGRIKRQQQFIKALLAKGIQKQSLKELEALVRLVSGNFVTNLSLVDILALTRQLQGLDPERVKMFQITGEPVRIEGVEYLQPKIVETRNLVSEIIRNIDVLIPSEIKVGVLNGSGALGLARTTAALLEEHDLQVVFYGNADNFNYKESFLIDFRGDPRRVELVRKALPGQVRVVTPEEFAKLGVGSLDKLAQMGYNLNKVDLLFIGGAGFKVGS